MSLQKSLPVAAIGTERLITAPFLIQSVRVDNPSGLWLYVKEATTQYIPPNTLGWLQILTPPISAVHITYVNSPGGGAVSAATGSPISCTVYENLLPTSNGLAYTAASSTDIAGLQTTLDDIAANQAAQATEATLIDVMNTLFTVNSKLDTIAFKQDVAQDSLDLIMAYTQPVNNATVQSTIAIGTSATLIRTTTAQEALAFHNNDAAKTIWIGPSSVTNSGANLGFPISPGGDFTIDFVSGQSIYGVTSAGTANLILLRGAIT